jgi:hypothetical protein
MQSITRAILVALFAFALSTAAQAQTTTYIGSQQALRVTIAPGTPASQPANELYRIELLSQNAPNSVTVKTLTTTGTPGTWDIPHAQLPDGAPFWVTVRAERTTNVPDPRSNILGPFAKATMATPTISTSVVAVTP